MNRDHRLVFECLSWLSVFHSPAKTLQEYEKQTGIILPTHSLVGPLNCGPGSGRISAMHSLVEQLNCDSGRISYRRFLMNR